MPTNLNNITNSQYTQLYSMFMQQGGGSGAEFSTFVNSIFGAGFNIEAALNGEGDEKEAGKMNLINMGYSTLMRGLSSLLSGAANAKKDVQENEQKIQSTYEQYKTDLSETKGKIKRTLDSIQNENIKDLSDAVDVINKDQQDATSIQEELDQKQQQINECIEAIKAAQASGKAEDLETIKTNLTTLSELQASIPDLVAKITTISTDITTQTEKVTQTTANLKVKEGKLAEAYNKELEKATSKATKDITAQQKEALKMNVTGAEETATGNAIMAKATAESTAGVATLGITEAAAAEDIVKAERLLEAGATHTTGAGKNMTTIGSNLGDMGSEFKDVSAYATTIGNVLTNAETLIGQYSTSAAALSGTIVAVGSQIAPMEAKAFGENITADVSLINSIDIERLKVEENIEHQEWTINSIRYGDNSKPLSNNITLSTTPERDKLKDIKIVGMDFSSGSQN